jgi:hypothetical protein
VTLASTSPSSHNIALLGVVGAVLFLGLAVVFGYAASHPDGRVGKWARFENNWNGAMPGPRTIRLGGTTGFRTASAVLALAAVASLVAGLTA